MIKLFTAAVVLGTMALAATHADARNMSRSDAYLGSAYNERGYDSNARGPMMIPGDQTYYRSYNNDHAYGYRTEANRPMDSSSMNKRHLEGWE